MYFGIAAVSFAAVLQILTLPSLDTELWISLYCFSISIPVNVFMGYIWTYLSEIFSYRTAFVSEIIGTAGGNGIASIGIAAIFWHFSSTIGIIFLISGAFGWCLFGAVRWEGRHRTPGGLIGQIQPPGTWGRSKSGKDPGFPRKSDQP
jgi:cobalamin synthase